MSRLAINGGSPLRRDPYPEYRTIGEEEKRAAIAVIESGVLSKFLGTWSPEFHGGPQVQALEREWAEYVGIKHAVTMNSATSGLYAAVGAAGVGPGDEVIVSPYTMAASATAALVYGAIPMFADIDPDTFCISPASIRARLTPHTRAIIAVDIFGHPADLDEIMAIAREHNLTVIEDVAQAPGGRVGSRYAGTLGHIGVFSLNYHKTIHTGEGGVCVTGDDELADRLKLIRNHAEAVVKAKGTKDLTNLVGFNYRMTEIEAAIGREQLKKLDGLLAPRIEAAAYLDARLSKVPGIATPVVRPGVKHAYYVYVMRYDATVTGVPRKRLAEALKAEGIPISEGYVEPIYLQPLYQQRIGYGRDGFPFTYPGYKGSVSYERGICPVTERMHFEEVLLTNICHADIRERDLDDFARAFEKVSSHLDELRPTAAGLER